MNTYVSIKISVGIFQKQKPKVLRNKIYLRRSPYRQKITLKQAMRCKL